MLILASASPRRQEILRAAGVPFLVHVTGVDETPLESEAPEAHVRRLAKAKALAVPAAPGQIVLGADTTVTLNGEILAKPAGEADAARMLRLLSGRDHVVITGICLRRGDRAIVDAAHTRVWFEPLSDADIASYIASGEPLDKAGAYGIQGLASKFVSRIDGCYFNVVGLPIALVYRHLRDLEQSA